jgi:hypothetical protein
MNKIIKPNIANIRIGVKNIFIFIIEQLLLLTTPAVWQASLKLQNISRPPAQAGRPRPQRGRTKIAKEELYGDLFFAGFASIFAGFAWSLYK